MINYARLIIIRMTTQYLLRWSTSSLTGILWDDSIEFKKGSIIYFICLSPLSMASLGSIPFCWWVQFLTYIKYVHMGSILRVVSTFARCLLLQILSFHSRIHYCFFFNKCRSRCLSVIGKYFSHLWYNTKLILLQSTFIFLSAFSTAIALILLLNLCQSLFFWAHIYSKVAVKIKLIIVWKILAGFFFFFVGYFGFLMQFKIQVRCFWVASQLCW